MTPPRRALLDWLAAAIAAELRGAEAELAALPSAAAAGAVPVKIRDGEIDAALRRLLMRLHDVLQGDVTRARSLLAELLGRVTIERQGEEVWAEAAIDTARLLVAAGGGSLLNVVAGGRFLNWKRWRLA